MLAEKVASVLMIFGSPLFSEWQRVEKLFSAGNGKLGFEKWLKIGSESRSVSSVWSDWKFLIEDFILSW